MIESAPSFGGFAAGGVRMGRLRGRMAASTLIVCVLLIPLSGQRRPHASTRPAADAINLVRNGDFAKPAASGKLPEEWTTTHRDNVRVIDGGGRHARVIEMSGKKKLMASYGVDLLSHTIPVKPNTRYRCTGVTRSNGPQMKVFVRGYATVTRSVDGELRTSDDAVYTMRKDIDPTDDWTPFNLEFDISPARVFSDHRHTIQYVRVKLWAYWPVGTCWFDDIRLEEVGPLPADAVRDSDAVTHAVVKPRLGPRASAASKPSTLDEEQVWIDAANAFRQGHWAEAAKLGECLASHAPANGSYRLLLARSYAKLERWPEAERQASWILGDHGTVSPETQPVRKIEPWQRDWANVVRAEVWWRTGRVDAARRLLDEILRAEASPHAQRAAQELLARLNESD